MSIIKNSDTDTSNRQLPKLTRKQASFVKGILENPKVSAVKIAQETYNASTYNSANQIAVENLQKPTILMHLQANSDVAERKIVELAINGKKEETQLAASKDILDRVHGKATQRVETQSTSVNISIDLT